MKISYDPKVDAAYIYLKKGKAQQTRKITDEIMVDVDKNGKPVGIEILSASKNISAFKPSSITFNWEDLSNGSSDSQIAVK